MRRKFSIANLDALGDGRVRAMIDRQMKAIAQDMLERPNEKGARRLNIEVACVPMADNEVCVATKVEFTITSKLPARRSREYEMGVHGTGELTFNAESPDDSRQGTLDEG